MKRFLANMVHGVAIAGQVINANHYLIPLKFQPQVAAGLAAAQLIVGLFQHNYNPDGTPAAVPYIPPSKK